MLKNSLELIFKKHAFKLLSGIISVDAYRRTVRTDVGSQLLKDAKADREQLAESRRSLVEDQQAMKQEHQLLQADLSSKQTKTIATSGRYQEAASKHQAATDEYDKNPTELNKREKLRLKEKLDKAYEEVSDINKSNVLGNVFGFLNSMYENFVEYLESLGPDKIVCIFNLIMGY
jgi:Skp family chaperone for outer membrane proteins